MRGVVLRLLALLTTVGVSAFAPGAVEAQDPPPSAAAATAEQPTAGAKKPAPRLLVIYENGLLSVTARGPLYKLLNEVSQRTGVAFDLDDALEHKVVSIQFEALALDEGVRRILKDRDAFYFYGVKPELPGEEPEEKTKEAPEQRSERPSGEPSASLMAVWVYPKGKGLSLKPVPPEKWASTADFEGWLSDRDPEMRARAVAVLVERKGQMALEAVLQLLGDADDHVRTSAIDAALNEDVELPPDSLADLVIRDPSPSVRFMALEALAGHPEAAGIAELALEDENPFVREKARLILSRLGRASQADQAPEPDPARQQQRPENQ